MLIEKITPISGKLLLKGFLPSEFLQALGIESEVIQYLSLWLLSKLYIFFDC